MVLPLVLLSIPAIAIGFWNVNGDFGELINGALPADAVHEVDASINWGIAGASLALAAGGILLAWLIYGAQAIKAESVRRAFGPLATLVEQRYYMDDLYERVLVGGVVYGGLARVSALFDYRVVDGIVNGAAALTRWSGGVLRRTQTGQLQSYGVAFAAGVLVIVAAILIINP
jgi:NADH-quinone oxidoreductase subunit L